LSFDIESDFLRGSNGREGRERAKFIWLGFRVQIFFTRVRYKKNSDITTEL